MFVTYPPIGRTQLFVKFKNYHSSDTPPASRILACLSGITLGKIADCTGQRAGQNWTEHSLLWPEEAWSAYMDRQFTGKYPRSLEVVLM
jgi:hypothetical protein